VAPILKLTRLIYVSGIQQLTQNGIKGHGQEKEVNLSSLNNVGTHSVEWAEIARSSEDIVPVAEM
jgi:hypothetical protein